MPRTPRRRMPQLEERRPAWYRLPHPVAVLIVGAASAVVWVTVIVAVVALVKWRLVP